MNKLHPDLRNFLTGALGYLAGAAAALLLIVLAARFNLLRGLLSLIDQDQTLVKVLGIPVFAGLILALCGAVLGGIGGWVLAKRLGVTRKRLQVAASSIAYAISVSVLALIFLLLISFVAMYNNLTTNRVDQFGIIFGLFGLVFGLLAGLLQGLMSLCLRYAWKVLLASILGYMLGGGILGLIIRLVNPTTTIQSSPVLTVLVLVLGLAVPFALGGGALGFTYGRLLRQENDKGITPEALQPSGWQLGIVAGIGLALTILVFSTLRDIKGFLTIQPANLQAQISPQTTGVRWSEPQPVSSGNSGAPAAGTSTEPLVINAPDGAQHKTWCSADGKVQYQMDDQPVDTIDFPGCSSPPAMALDRDGMPHLVWYTNQIQDTNGVVHSAELLVESILSNDIWGEATIAAQLQGPAQPSLALDEEENLVLTWQEEGQELMTAVQEEYLCDPEHLTDIEKAGLESILAGEFRPEGSPISYCGNQFVRLLYTPNPEPAYSQQPATDDGGFDILATVAETAQYEVLFTTMQWDPDTSHPNPGSVLAEGIADLYQRVQENPEQYPRGMTVRILLGNYPVMANFQYGEQIMDAISDLRNAGVDRMVDEEIGWRLEVANFAGTYPHAHTKFMVLDGAKVTSAGFNFGYLHFPIDHPSGKGYNLFDLGMKVDGPVAQDAIAAYDDMWNGANQVICDDLSLENENWQRSCQEVKATVSHVPEVLRTYLPPSGTSDSFALYRTTNHQEADTFIKTSLAASQESIDAIQVNFSLEMICMVNLVFPDVCTIDNALPWMNAMLDAVENNGVYLRVIMENTNSNGLENRVAVQVLKDELERRGLSDKAEFRFFNGKLHAKSILIDDKLLFIGSQNLHYSAWGENGLAEFSLSSNDPDAIAEYQKLFEAKWAEAIPFEEAEYGTSP